MAGGSYIANGFGQCVTVCLTQLTLIIHVSNKISQLTEGIFFQLLVHSKSANSVV